MIVCLCNCLKDSQINCAREQGACRVSEMFAKLGCQPQCGKCVPHIRASLRDTSGPEAYAT